MFIKHPPHFFLCTYSHFREFSPFIKDLQIYILAFFKFLKQLVFFLPIAIHFPHSTALAILSFVINKSFHVFQRIAKKNPYFMWETSTFQKSIFQMFHAGINIGIFIAIALVNKFWTQNIKKLSVTLYSCISRTPPLTSF